MKPIDCAKDARDSMHHFFCVNKARMTRKTKKLVNQLIWCITSAKLTYPVQRLTNEQVSKDGRKRIRQKES